MSLSRVAACCVSALLLLLLSCLGVDVAARDAPHVRDGSVTAGAISLAGESIPTQCAACRDYGTCDLAFRGLAGQFCHTVDWSGLACCCPRGSECINSRPSQCLCREIGWSFDDVVTAIFCLYLLVAVSVIVLDIFLEMLEGFGIIAPRSQKYRCITRRDPTTAVYDPAHTGNPGTYYGSTTTFSGDAGGSGGSFAGDTGGDDGGGTFAGDS